jgi:nucleoside-diphosphate-sugar epimerase
MNTTILIGGASGATGSVTTRLLLQKGFPVRALVHQNDGGGPHRCGLAPGHRGHALGFVVSERATREIAQFDQRNPSSQNSMVPPAGPSERVKAEDDQARQDAVEIDGAIGAQMIEPATDHHADGEPSRTNNEGE